MISDTTYAGLCCLLRGGGGGESPAADGRAAAAGAIVPVLPLHAGGSSACIAALHALGLVPLPPVLGCKPGKLLTPPHLYIRAKLSQT